VLEGLLRECFEQGCFELGLEVGDPGLEPGGLALGDPEGFSQLFKEVFHLSIFDSIYPV